jgi:hypothetical protein
VKEDETMEDVADVKIDEEDSDESEKFTATQSKHSRKQSKNLPDVITYKKSQIYLN